MTMSSTEDALPFAPLLIIGAGRSGTNALRNCLTALDGFATWPCDEINPIWRHGNLDWPNDEIPPDRAIPEVRAFIRSAFKKIWRQRGRPEVIVEKTCANTLRVPFVNRVLPEARYIHLVRNGLDVVASAQLRWKGELEVPGFPYFLAKARYTPLIDLPRYAASAVKSRLRVKLGRQKHLGSWGPRFEGLDDLLDAPLEEIVARQWVRCATLSASAFAEMPVEKVITVRYERFVSHPAEQLGEILDWFGSSRPDAERRSATSLITGRSVGKGTRRAETLSPDIRAIIDPALRKLHYPT